MYRFVIDWLSGLPARLRRPAPSTERRRVEWRIFHEHGHVGAILTDLDTEQWASGSARTERAARRLAAHRLEVSPSGHPRVVGDSRGAETPVRRKHRIFDGITAG